MQRWTSMAWSGGRRKGLRGNAWWLDSLEDIQTNPQVAATIENQLADYNALTPADLQQAARRFLVPGHAWKLVIVPEAAPPAAQTASPPATH